MNSEQQQIEVKVGDTVKCRDRHRYVVTEADGGTYSDTFNGFGAQKLQRKGYAIRVAGRIETVNESFRSLSVTDVVTASRNGKVVYRATP